MSSSAHLRIASCTRGERRSRNGLRSSSMPISPNGCLTPDY
jgi:hypothetical protein